MAGCGWRDYVLDPWNTYSRALDAIWPPPIELDPIELGPDDKRRAARRRAGLYGRLAYGGQATGLVGCEILDLSDAGVRVETFAQIDELPELLSLEFGGVYNRARRCWTHGREIGLEFISDEVQSLQDK